jgi:hypothetical protein
VLHSAEARWFILEVLPDEALDWFSAGHPPDSEGVQIHEYLCFPNCESVGVKLREGRLEIKAMLSAPRPLSRDLGVSGRTDQWVKWSFASEGLKNLDPGLHQSGRWLKVRKERFLRKFSADRGALAEITGRQGPFPAIGCDIELTRIEVEAIPRFWFSLAFEALGPPAVTTKLLECAVHSFFKEHGRLPGIPLTEGNSLNYPAWLVKLTDPSLKTNDFSSYRA